MRSVCYGFLEQGSKITVYGSITLEYEKVYLLSDNQYSTRGVIFQSEQKCLDEVNFEIPHILLFCLEVYTLSSSKVLKNPLIQNDKNANQLFEKNISSDVYFSCDEGMIMIPWIYVLYDLIFWFNNCMLLQFNSKSNKTKR